MAGPRRRTLHAAIQRPRPLLLRDVVGGVLRLAIDIALSLLAVLGAVDLATRMVFSAGVGDVIARVEPGPFSLAALASAALAAAVALSRLSMACEATARLSSSSITSVVVAWIVTTAAFVLGLWGGVSALAAVINPAIGAASGIAFLIAGLGLALYMSADSHEARPQRPLSGLRRVHIAVSVFIAASILPAIAATAISAERVWIAAWIAAPMISASAIWATASARPLLKYERTQYDRLGPSVSKGGVLGVFVGAPAILAIAYFAERVGAVTGATPGWLSWSGVLALAVAGAVAVNRAWRERGLVERRDPEPPRSTANRFKLTGRSRRRPLAERLDRALWRCVIAPTRRPRERLRAAVDASVEFAQAVLSFVDVLFVYVAAPVFALNAPNRLPRYIGFAAHMSAAAGITAFAPGYGFLIGVGWAALYTFVLVRLWRWSDRDRRTTHRLQLTGSFARATKRIGYDVNYSDQTLLAFCTLFLVILPFAMNSAFGSAEIVFDPSQPLAGLVAYARAFVTWLQYLGGEIVRALPMVDWAEAYGVEGPRSDGQDSGISAHIAFAIRVGVDLILLAAVVRLLTPQERSPQLDFSGDDTEAITRIHDPLVERRFMIRALRDQTTLIRLRLYDAGRLIELMSSLDDRPTALGAARVAGFGLCAEAMERLLATDLSTGVVHTSSTDVSSPTRWLLRDKAVEGLKQRERLSAGAQIPFDVVLASLHDANARRNRPPPNIDNIPIFENLKSPYRDTKKINNSNEAIDYLRNYKEIEMKCRRCYSIIEMHAGRPITLNERFSEDGISIVKSMITSKIEGLAIAALATWCRLRNRNLPFDDQLDLVIERLWTETRPKVLIIALSGLVELSKRRDKRMSDSLTYEPLVRLLTHPNYEVRLAAAKATPMIWPNGMNLGQGGSQAISDAVKRALRETLTFRAAFSPGWVDAVEAAAKTCGVLRPDVMGSAVAAFDRWVRPKES